MPCNRMFIHAMYFTKIAPKTLKALKFTNNGLNLKSDLDIENNKCMVLYTSAKKNTCVF